MASFTALLNRAHRRFIDKHLKRRSFGACESCDKRTLLVRLAQESDNDTIEWDLCESCYDKMIDEEYQ
jgi:hypothetical protein